jgi:hypothetical protein
MMRRRISAFGLRLALVFVGVSGGVMPVAGQSLYNAAGLGMPVEAVDGRARALGNLGIGLRGGSFMPTDPGSLGRLRVSTGVMAAQPQWIDYQIRDGAAGSVQGTRFPLLGIAYPLFRGMMSVQIGSFMDQNYEVQRTTTVDFGRGLIDTTDDFQQDGSIANLNLGFSRMFGERFSAGLTVGRYAGSMERSLTRTYGDELTTDVDSYVEAGTWSYGAWAFTGGVAADLFSRARVAVSVHVPASLDAEADEGTRGADRSYTLPIQYRAGASVSLSPALVVSGSILLADWSDTAPDLAGASVASDQHGFGAGLELSRATFFGKNAPLRLGFRQSGIPFAFDEGATERIVSGGFGLELSQSGDVVLAGVDLAVERGHRFGGGINEKFWRATISLLASGL